jgi:hypothetical protein
MALKVVYKAPSELLAYSIRDLLRQNGVPVWLRTFQVSAYGGIGQMLYPNWGELLVEELDFERAGELIAGFFGTELDSGEAD